MPDGQVGADTWRGGCGPLKLERSPATNPLFSAFFEAAQQAGYPLTDDVNGYRQEGFGRFDRNIVNGRRMSAARAYLHPVMGRKNLTVETFAHATKVRFEGKRAVGVEYLRAGRRHQYVGAGEVILCGGAINSPQLLQLSGIGNPDAPAAPRRGHGPRPAGRGGEPPGPPRGLHPVRLAPAGLDRRGPQVAQPPAGSATSGCSSAAASAPPTTSRAAASPQQRRRRLAQPDVPLPAHRDPLRRLAARGQGPHGYQVHIGPMYADTRGWVRIATTDPKQNPKMLFNYLSTPNDRREWVEAVRVARDILNQPAFAPFNAGELSPGPRSRPTRRSSTGSARTPRPRCTPRARRRWASTTCRSPTPAP